MRPFTSLLLSALFAWPTASRADWLDLGAGTWDVTLTCRASSVACPASFHASLVVDGAGATAFSTMFNGETFSGDPIDSVVTVDGYTADKSSIVLDPFAFFYLASDVNEPNPLGLTNHWWTYCTHSAANACVVTSDGDWTATLVSPVPEPSSWALMAAGVAGLGAMRRRRALQAGCIDSECSTAFQSAPSST